jgi:ATP-dependent Zn protease
MVIPRYPGDFTIPAIQFSYFDTKSGTYKTLSSEEYNLHVEKGKGGSEAPVVSNYTNRESVRFLGQDIRYIKVDKPHFIENKDIFFGSFLYWMAYLMMAALFIVFFIIYRKQVEENANIALVRTKKANKMAVKRLKQA